MTPLIALMTDFGTRDHYVAAMKGVILQINPRANIVDITHEIDPYDWIHGAFVLRQALPYFPPKTIFAVVVDPTVGTDRRILAARYNDRVVIAPDNGLLTLVHRDGDLETIRIVENRQYFAANWSNTFQGRDIFAPVAAHVSQGVPLEHLGPVADRLEILDLPRPHFNGDGTIQGQVLVIDHFGNLITNISTADLSAARSRSRRFEVCAGDHQIGPLQTTFADVPPGHPVAMIGSSHMLEIAVNRGNAAEALKLTRGDAIVLHHREF